MSESTLRQRSRLACTLCQSRKRKCSGGQPCSTCAQTGAECQYNARKKRARSHSLYQASLLSERPPDARSNAVLNTISAAANSTVQASPRRASSSDGVTHSLQANSGATFVRKLGLKIDPAHAPGCNCLPGMLVRDGYRQHYLRRFHQCLPRRRHRRLLPKSYPRKRCGG